MRYTSTLFPLLMYQLLIKSLSFNIKSPRLYNSFKLYSNKKKIINNYENLKNNNTVYILDGTAMLYRSYYGMESKKKFIQMKTSNLYGNIPCSALIGLSTTFARFLREFQPKYIAAAFDSGKTFRNDLFPDYKQQRDKPDDELCAQFQYAPKILQSMGCLCLQQRGYEADDLMASLSDKILSDSPDKNIIHVSFDKDMLQLINSRVSIMNPQTRKIWTEKEVIEKFGVPPEKLCDLFAFIGDSADNIPGVKGIGPKTAAALIKHFHSIDKIYEMVENSSKSIENQNIFLNELKSALNNVKVSHLAVFEALKNSSVSNVLLFKQLVSLRKDITLSNSDQLPINKDTNLLNNILDNSKLEYKGISLDNINYLTSFTSCGKLYDLIQSSLNSK